MRAASNILHLGIKELRSLARDPIMLILIGWAFSVSIYTAATAMPETLNRAPIAIVDEDRSPLSERIAGAFLPPYFLPPVLITRAEMDQRMDAGLDTFALDIPPGFQRDLLAGRRPEIQLNVDATRMSQAFSGSGHIQAIIAEEVRRFAGREAAGTTPPVDLVLRARFNPALDKSWFGAIVQVINNVTMLSIVLTGAALIREREHGTIEHLLAMPVTPFEIMCSKVWAMALVVLAAWHFQWRRRAAAVAAVAIIYGAVVNLWLVPHFRGDELNPLAERYGYLGDSATEILLAIPARPAEVVRHVVTWDKGAVVLLLVLLAAAGAPLLRPVMFLAGAPLVILPALSQDNDQARFELHYLLAPTAFAFSCLLVHLNRPPGTWWPAVSRHLTPRRTLAASAAASVAVAMPL